jgi:hypothetical protein
MSERREAGIPPSSERSPRVEQRGPAPQAPRAGDMSNPQNVGVLDRARLRELFDLRSQYNETHGGSYQDDP